MKLTSAASAAAFVTVAALATLSSTGPALAQASQPAAAAATTASAPAAPPAPAAAAGAAASRAVPDNGLTAAAPAGAASAATSAASGVDATTASPTRAVTQPPLPASATNMMQVVTGLGLVLALLIGATYFLKRMNGNRARGTTTIRIVGGVSVGNRERVMVVEVGDQWIVVGVANGSVRSLANMPRQVPASRTAMDDDEAGVAPGAANFSSWLKQKIDQRNGRS